MPVRTFTTTSRGLRRDTPPMRLYEKAKQLGIWNPSDIDFTQDRQDWLKMSELEQDILMRLTALFQAGEEAVTLDLLPLIGVMAAEGRLEEEMFLTTFLWEEAKHVDFFHRFIDEVTQNGHDLSHYMTASYASIIEESLPSALNALKTDASPAAQARASTVYNMVVEGILAETGYHAYFSVLDKEKILPGTRKGIALLKQDESRHIAYGIFLLSRLMAEDESLWEVVESTMNELLAPALSIVSDVFSLYEVPPFGLEESVFSAYAMGQFSKRLERVRNARGKSLEEVYAVTQKAIEDDDS